MRTSDKSRKMKRRREKHVIFLGAGASFGSGYPLASQLRLLLSSREHFEKAITEYEDQSGLKDKPIWRHAQHCFTRNEKALQLFRHGGFATVDEFCKLAGKRFHQEIDQLRQMIRGVLGLFNPEENFHKSEYYEFVQKLFESDLVTLRHDVTVLTYNYDLYLEYVLWRALRQRWAIGGQSDDTNLLNAVTSGFFDPSNQNWLRKSGFSVLKLHGSIGYPNDEVLGCPLFFQDGKARRAEKLFAYEGAKLVPPIMFPWEIISDRGTINRLLPIGGAHQCGDAHVKKLFNGIWKRARRAVQQADRISFVGLSMHPFMNEGLKYLLKGKTGRAELIVANTENVIFEQSRRETYWTNNPQSPGALFLTMFRNFAPDCKTQGVLPGQGMQVDALTLLKDFRSFIRTQLQPRLIKTTP
jgi:hypothetical protein